MRIALFVDAGYLLAEAGAICAQTKNRAEISCDYVGLLQALARYVVDHSKMALLRVYWYDGARDAIPGPEHQLIAEQPYVKLRLGRLAGARQKGVDALIFRDMFTLARERAISRAYLLSGDEDLREAVVASQDLGVQVVLIGVAGSSSNQARTLRQEADECLTLDRDFLRPYFRRTEEIAQGPPPEIDPKWVDWVEHVGVEFGEFWVNKATPEELEKLRARYPRVPQELDAQMMRYAEQRLGQALRASEGLRRLVRKGFWRRVMARSG